MNHEKALEYALSEGPMPAEYKTHLENCERCRRELEALRDTESLLKEANPSYADGGLLNHRLAETLQEELKSESKNMKIGPSRWFRVIAASSVAASFAAALVVFSALPSSSSGSALSVNSESSLASTRLNEAGSSLLQGEQLYEMSRLVSSAETQAVDYESSGDEADTFNDNVYGGDWNG